MFASQVFEQEPPHWGGFPLDLETWVQIMGGFSAAALLIYLIVRFFRGPARTAQIPWSPWQVGCFRVLVTGMFVGYLSWFVLMAPVALSALVGSIEGGDVQLSRSLGSDILRRCALLIGAGSAFLAVALPFLADLLQAR